MLLVRILFNVGKEFKTMQNKKTKKMEQSVDVKALQSKNIVYIVARWGTALVFTGGIFVCAVV